MKNKKIQLNFNRGKEINSNTFRNWLSNQLNLLSIEPTLKKSMIDSIISKKIENLNFAFRNKQNTDEKKIHQFYSRILQIKFRTCLLNLLTSTALYFFLFLITILYHRKIEENMKYDVVLDLPQQTLKSIQLKQFKNYFSQKQFKLNDYLIIQTNRLNLKSKSYNNSTSTFKIEIFLIAGLNLRQRMSYLRNLSKNFCTYLKLSISFPAIVELGKLFIVEKAISELVVQHKLISSISITNSSYVKQHYLCHLAQNNHEISSNMFWYSENSYPKLFSDGNNIFDYSYFKDIQVKTHYVWTREFANFLSQFTDSEIIPVGSIIFYSKDSSESIEKEDKILIFDVTPFSASNGGDYYNFENCSKFLIDIFSALESNKNFEILLKPKRKFTKKHSKSYLDLVNKFQNKYSKFSILPFDVNLYTAIENSKIVIALPFTSAALIAKEVNTEVIYYNPNSNIDFPSNFNGVQVVTGSGALKSFINKTLV